MFKFNFSNLDIEEGVTSPADSPGQVRSSLSAKAVDPEEHDKNPDQVSSEVAFSAARELSEDELTQSLPPAFSYSPLVIPLSDDHVSISTESTYRGQRYKGTVGSVALLRRDLFDARYQLISESDTDTSEHHTGAMQNSDGLRTSEPCLADDALKFIDNPSDLVPGVYEGGLKTWECALDLVDYLAEALNEKDGGAGWVGGKRVLEIGCGTAIPSLLLLHILFSRPQTPEPNAETPWTEFVLQDYNDLVLRLVTFPNVLLQWYASPLAEAYRLQHPPEDEVIFNPDAPGDLQITPDLLSAFHASLQEKRILIRFIAGSWGSIRSDESLCAFPFDITFTSETIYQTSSLPSLISLLKRASQGRANESDGRGIVKRTWDLSLEEDTRLCVVAAKLLYFGVGGGIMEFESAIHEAGGKVTTVLERKPGIGRKVMKIQWSQS